MNTLFRALNDPTRRQILELLRSGERTAGALAASFDISKPSLSHHLDLLLQAGLVLRERRGQQQVYSLQTTVMDELLAWVLSLRTSPAAERPDQKAEASVGAPPMQEGS